MYETGFMLSLSQTYSSFQRLTRNLRDRSVVPVGQVGVKFSIKHHCDWNSLQVGFRQSNVLQGLWGSIKCHLKMTVLLFTHWKLRQISTKEQNGNSSSSSHRNLMCSVLFWIIPLTAFECCITRATDHTEFVLEERTKCMGGSERTEDFPSVVMVRWNSPANHLVLSSPIEPMLENWPITGHLSSPGTGSVWSYKSW